MRYLIILTMALLSACSQSPEIQTDKMSDGGLANVKHSGFDKAYVDPDGKLKSYSKFIFAPLDTSEVEVEEPEIDNMRKSDWDFTDRDAKQLSDAYMKSVTNAFKKAEGLSLVDEAGSGVLLVKSKLTRFAPTTPKYNSVDRTSRSKFYAKSSANFTLETELVDSQTNKQLATIIESREMGDDLTMREINVARYAMDVRMGFDRWARNFKSSLEKILAN